MSCLPYCAPVIHICIGIIARAKSQLCRYQLSDMCFVQAITNFVFLFFFQRTLHRYCLPISNLAESRNNVRITPAVIFGASELTLCKSFDATKTNYGNWIFKARKDSSLPFDLVPIFI